LTVGRDGIITAGFDSKGGGQLVNGQWSTFPLGAASTLVTIDQSGDVWLGTFGNGLWLVENEVRTNYDETNSTMRGNNDNPPSSYSFIVNSGVTTDNRYLYSACYRAYTINPIAIGDLNNLDDLSGWISLDSIQGITNEFVSCLDVFGEMLAVGTEGIGFYECNLGPNPLDTSDDICVLYDVNSSNIPSNTIRTVKYSPTGELWVGTNFGLSRYDFGIERFVDVALPAGIGPDIKVLELDSRSNLWVGSINGIARVKGIDGTAEVYNTLNSGLVSNSVRNIHYDEFTGKVYVATDGGISVISSTFGKPTADVNSILAFPNPYVIDSPDDELEFNFFPGGIVRIYSMAGELVREIQIGRRWNGRNEQGKDVASGVYIFVLTDSGGNVGRGKILLIRK
jgi:hypothetical protein